MAAVKTDRLCALRDAIDDLALGYMSDLERFKGLLDSVRKKIVYFDNTSITDLNSIMLNLHKRETDPVMREKLENVMQCLSDAIIAEIHLPRYRNIKGLSIFLPDEATVGIMPYYVHAEFGLDFVQDANWDELLFSIFPPGATSQGDIDETAPMFLGRISRAL